MCRGVLYDPASAAYDAVLAKNGGLSNAGIRHDWLQPVTLPPFRRLWRVSKAAAERSIQPSFGTAVSSGDEDANRSPLSSVPTTSLAVVEFLPTNTVVFSGLAALVATLIRGSVHITPPVPPVL